MKKKSLITIFSLFAVVIVGLLVGVIVLASQTHNLNSNISISYTVTEISGGVSATYKIGDDDEKDMVVNGNTSKLVATFDADLNSTTQGLSPTESQLVLLAKQDLIFTYTFFNRGDYPYYATLNYTDSNNDDMNIDVYYKSASDAEFSMDNPTQIQVPAMVGEVVGTTTYQVKMTIHDSSFDSRMSGVFNWNLSKEKPLNISLAYTNNTDSAINPENVTIKTNKDKTQFKIVGPTPIVADGSTTNLTELTNASGSEFYYFASNSEVKDTTGYTDPGTTYYISPYSAEESASSMYTYGQGLQNMSATIATDPSQYTANEVWYDMPAKPTIIYATFMTPNNRTGDSSGGAEGDLIISHSVHAIVDRGFIGSSMTNCIIPNTISRIGDHAFGDSNLTRVVIPESVKYIGTKAFGGCSLTKVKIPNSVTSVGSEAFIGCDNLGYNSLKNVNYLGNNQNPYMMVMGVTDKSLKKYEISPNAKIIYNEAFYNCSNLDNIIIPTGVNTIGERSFSGCSSLINIQIPEGIISIGHQAFSNCIVLVNISIPMSVISIGDSVFSGCTMLQQVTIPGRLTNIGKSTFSNCINLTNVNIPMEITSIGDSTFFCCSSLVDFIIPESVTSIGNSAFYGCSRLTNINIPNKLISIGNDAFSFCYSLRSIELPNTVANIGYNPFAACSSLERITVASGNNEFICVDNCLISISNKKIISVYNDFIIPTDGRVNCIGEKVFYAYSDLTSISLPDTITSICDQAFFGCSNLTNVTIPMGVTSIGNSVFSYCCSLLNVIIPDGVTSIGDYTFSCCCSLTSVSMPNGVLSIGQSAFRNCSNLTNITIPGGVTNIEFATFRNCSALTSITIPEDVTSIGSWAFSGCNSLTKITIPNKVTTIESYAFYGCEKLKSVTIGSGVTGIESKAFKDCDKILEVYNLSGLNIASGSTNNGYVGNYAKVIHTSLSEESIIKEVDGYQYMKYKDSYYLLGYKGTATELVLPEKLDGNNYIINQYAFYNCSTLTNIIIPDSIISIGDYAFLNCSGLKILTIPDSVTSLGYWSFAGCSGLKSLTIGDGITKILDSTFRSCSSLISIIIPEKITIIEVYAFAGCSNLTSVTFQNTSGWQVSTSSNFSSYTELTSDNFANTSTAATYLKSTYYNYYWKRS